MKTATAKLNYLRMAPRKMRLVANMLKKMSVNEAEAQLLMNPKRASEPILKLLRSAVSNGIQKGINQENLFIKEIIVNAGPMLKRHMPRAQGRGAAIQKKTSHISLILIESERPKKSRFNIVKPQRIKKSLAEKIKREKEKPKVEEKETKVVEKSGFMKKMFQRKSI